jgi:hypothetical protein
MRPMVGASCCAPAAWPSAKYPIRLSRFQLEWPSKWRMRPNYGLMRFVLLRPGRPSAVEPRGGLRQRAEPGARSCLRNCHSPARPFIFVAVIQSNVHCGQRCHKRIHEPSPCGVGSASNWSRGLLATGPVSTRGRWSVDQSKHVWSPEEQPGIHAPLHIGVGIAAMLHVWRRKPLGSKRLQNWPLQRIETFSPCAGPSGWF